MQDLRVAQRRLAAAVSAILITFLGVTEAPAKHPYVALDLSLYVDVSEPVAQKRADELEPFQDTLRAVWKTLEDRAKALATGHPADYVRIFLFSDKVADSAYWGGTLKDLQANETLERLLSSLNRARSDESMGWGLNRRKTDFEPVLDRLRSRPEEGQRSRPEEGQRHAVALIVSNGIHDTTNSRNRCIPRYESSDAEHKHLQGLVDRLRVRTALLITPCSIKDREPFFPFAHVWERIVQSNFAVFLSHNSRVPGFSDPTPVAESVLRYLRKDIVFVVPDAPVRIFGPRPGRWDVRVDAHRSLDLIVCPKEIAPRDTNNATLTIGRDVAIRIPKGAAVADGCLAVGFQKGQSKLPIELVFMEEAIRELLHDDLKRTARVEVQGADRRLMPESLNLQFDWGAPCINHPLVAEAEAGDGPRWRRPLCLIGFLLSPEVVDWALTVFWGTVVAITLASLHVSRGLFPWGWRLYCRVHIGGVAGGARATSTGWQQNSRAWFNGFRISPSDIVIADGGKWLDHEMRLKREEAIRVWPFTADNAAAVATAGSAIRRLKQPASDNGLVDDVDMDIRHPQVVSASTCGEPLWIWAVPNSPKAPARATGVGISLKWERRPGLWGVVRRLPAVRSVTLLYGCVHGAFWLCLAYFGLVFWICKHYGVLEYWSPWASIASTQWAMVIVGPLYLSLFNVTRRIWADVLELLRGIVRMVRTPDDMSG